MFISADPLNDTPAIFRAVARTVAAPAVRLAAVPLAFVATNVVGVPRLGVTKVGLVSTTNLVPVPVWDAMLVALPTEVITPVRLALVMTVVAFPTLVTIPVKLALVVTVPAVNPAAVPVMLVPTRVLGVPRLGVIRVGESSTTILLPVPVFEANEVALPIEVMGPVKSALVVTVPAVNPAAVPVILVPIRVEGVPRLGVTRVGLPLKTKAPVPVAPVLVTPSKVT